MSGSDGPGAGMGNTGGRGVCEMGLKYGLATRGDCQCPVWVSYDPRTGSWAYTSDQ